ncbi:putative 14-3-3 protein [Blattamonas nauphoetae]|uniref:14-3-3 protein n=1 Tax=Blattamonas nauphoetae TaxID=2049346 RepID=A0ABQ9X9R0_9EUKA|nr:putative 14-3-3 protein [Blattamonas nauphoetae]
MIDYSIRLVRLRIKLTREERNLVSVTFRNVVGMRRASLRTLYTIEKAELDKENIKEVKIVRKAIEEATNELTDYCTTIIHLVDDDIMKNDQSLETQVFVMKMKADYYRYLAEAYRGSKHAEYSRKSLSSYEEAMEQAKALSVASPLSLSVTLNYCVFQYEVLNDVTTALTVARRTFDSATSELDTLSEESYHDANLVIQILRTNITLWSSAPDEHQEQDNNNSKID